MAVPSQFLLKPSVEPEVFRFAMSDEAGDAGLACADAEGPDPSQPLRMRRAGETRRLRHFMEGPEPGSRIVSDGFKALLEAHDPGAHRFIPIALEMDPGVLSEQAVWLLKTGRVLRALEEESVLELTPIFDSKGRPVALKTSDWPLLSVQRDVIGEVPFWRQHKLVDAHFCSRSFLREITLRGLEPVRTIGVVKHESERFDDFS